ncbi:MAG: ABC transporter permease [Anaerolineae bacterium]
MQAAWYKKYAAHILIFVCALLMLLPFLRVLLALRGTGRFAAAAATASAAYNPAMLLVLVGAIAAVLLTLWSLFMPRFNRLASYLTVGAGLLSLGYYVLVFNQNTTLSPTIGIWLSQAGVVGLILQVFIPRPIEVKAAVQQPEPPAKTANTPTPKLKRGGSGVDLVQNIGVAFDALMANKLRSGLTMLGVIIGVMAVVSLISIGQGAQTAVTEQIQGTGVNLLFVTAANGAQTLTYQDAQELERQITGVNAVLPLFSQNLTVRSDEDTISTTVMGVTAQHAEITNLDLQIGRFISQEDYERRSRVAVLGTSAAEELFGGLNPLGRSVRIGSQRFEIIGVLEEQDAGFGADANLNIYVPLSTGYRNLYNARTAGSTDDRVSNIRISVTDTNNIAAITAQIQRILRDRHRIELGEDDDFNVIDQQQLLEIAGQITGILTVLLGAIAGVSLVVGGIGIMNISLVSVTERTKEIGLRKAIGARRSHILQQFLIETTVLSTLGGLIGVLLGVGIAMLVNSSGLLTATVTWDSILLGLGFSILVGVFFGVYPATRAAALPPIEALRYE